ncbi:hypothetical protein GCM10029964_041520 [Kibdelosporangium lantanae]
MASARDLYVDTGNEAALAEALNGLGWCHAQLGEYDQALVYCQQALAMHVKLGARISEADTMDSIGFIHHHLGDHSQAVAYYQRALAIDRELGDRNKQAEVLGHLGDAYAAAGENDQARLAWQEKLAVLEAISSPSAERLRARLADLPDPFVQPQEPDRKPGADHRLVRQEPRQVRRERQVRDHLLDEPRQREPDEPVQARGREPAPPYAPMGLQEAVPGPQQPQRHGQCDTREHGLSHGQREEAGDRTGPDTDDETRCGVHPTTTPNRIRL